MRLPQVRWPDKEKTPTRKELYRLMLSLSDRVKRLEEDVDSLVETLEILQDRELLESIRRGLEDVKAGRVYSLEELKSKLGP